MVALLVLSMVVVGGATRLTGSGLSITQWKPVTGALPPMSQKAWAEEFALYRATPQYQRVNVGMTLPQFRTIFWWEWAHRLLGRLVGAAFAIPMLLFLAFRRLPRRLIGRCVALLGLGGLQGLAGWWMVKSGLEARVSVAPERLAVHLGLALLLLAALVWTGLEAWFGPPTREGRRDGWTRVAAVALLAAIFQCLMGALVAGNQAGLIDNDWPMMGGSIIPVDYWRGGLWATIAHGASAAQFDHRAMAYGLLVLALGVAVAGLSSRRAPPDLRWLAVTLGLLVAMQVVLGIATLLSLVALPLALLHQVTAALIVVIAVAFAWRTRRP
jgi:cytochrome c oxidase assembly protein subunit 15